jgi:hypothetical protein
MRWSISRFRLWIAMVAVAIFAGVTAEMGQRRGPLVRLCIAHYKQADAYFDRIGRICKFGETAASIEALYRRQGPSAWLDHKAASYHLALASKYDEAANRTWLPLLAGTPPIDALRNVRSLAEWGMEAVMEATPLFGTLALLLTLRAGTTKTVVLSIERHGRTLIEPESRPRDDGATIDG